jgi:hypothetical protein
MVMPMVKAIINISDENNQIIIIALTIGITILLIMYVL